MEKHQTCSPALIISSPEQIIPLSFNIFPNKLAHEVPINIFFSIVLATPFIKKLDFSRYPTISMIYSILYDISTLPLLNHGF